MDLERHTRVYEGRRLKSETVETVRRLPSAAGNEDLWQTLMWLLCCVAFVVLVVPLFFFWDRPAYGCRDWDECYAYGTCDADDYAYCYGPYTASGASSKGSSCESAFMQAVERRRAEHRAAASRAWNETRAKHQTNSFYVSCTERRSRSMRDTEWISLQQLVLFEEPGRSMSAMMQLRMPLPFYIVRRNDTVSVVRSRRRLCDNELRCEGSLEFYRALFADRRMNPASVLAVEQYALNYDSDAASMSAGEARELLTPLIGAALAQAIVGSGARRVEFERGAMHASAGLFSRFSRSELSAYAYASFLLYSYDRSELDCSALSMLLADEAPAQGTFLDRVIAARRALADGSCSRPLAPPAIAARASGTSEADQCALHPATCAREMAAKCPKQ